MVDRDFDIDDGNWFPIMKEMADKLMVYRLSGTEHQVMYMFMRYCYGYHKSTCEMSWDDMKDFTGLQDGSLSKAISKLKRRNILHTFQKESKKGIRYKINSKISSWKSLSKRKELSKRKVDTFQKESTPIKINKNIYTSNRFDEWWNLYPKKVDKKKCKEKWKRRKLDKIADMLMADVKKRINTKKWQDGYIPNPLTYINGDRWEDEIKESGSTGLPGHIKRFYE